jgi:fatty acid desaturase
MMSGRPEKSSADDERIRGGLNALLVLSVFGAAVALIVLASRLGFPWAIVIAVAFSFLLLTNYALIHEGAHDNLHRRPRLNWLLGMLSGWMFPVSFTLLQVTHIVHHCCNRTDYESFDYYYPHDNRFLVYGQWYGLLTGLFWPVLPIGSIVLAIAPQLLHTRPFARARSTAVLFDDFGPRQILRVRVEVVLGIAFWTILFSVVGLRWDTTLLLYAFFAVNWSTRQYVTHAFTQRDVIHGALNLKVSRPMGWVLLNGQWDLVHHRHPKLPWTALAVAGQDSEKPVSYWRQYFRLWKGPRPCPQPEPKPLPRQNYEAIS